LSPLKEIIADQINSDGRFFIPEAQLTLFLRMRTKEVAQNIAKMYFDTQAIPLLQEIGITNANDEVRFLSSGPIYKESKVSPKCVVSLS